MLEDLITRYPTLSSCKKQISDATDILYNSFLHGRKLLLCGNGGSCSDCEHITGELMKGFIEKRPLSDEVKKEFSDLFGCEGENIASKLQGALPTISLPSQSGILSAFANDVDPELVYSQLVWGYGVTDDVLVAMSTSGNSKNIIKACMVAKIKGMKIIGFTGANSCKLDELCDVIIHVPETETYKIQELHLPVYHWICAELERRFFDKSYRKGCGK